MLTSIVLSPLNWFLSWFKPSNHRSRQIGRRAASAAFGFNHMVRNEDLPYWP